MRRFSSKLYSPCDLSFATSEGTTLRAEWGAVRYEFALACVYSDPDDFPVDVVEFRVWVADHRGDVWTAASRFTALRFAPSFGGSVTYARFSEAGEAVVRAFEPPLALGPVYAGLNGFGSEPIRIGSEVYDAYLKYATVELEVAYVPSDDPDGGYLAVRTVSGSLSTRNSEPLPVLWYAHRPGDLWAWNTAAPDMDYAEDVADGEMEAKWAD